MKKEQMKELINLLNQYEVSIISDHLNDDHYINDMRHTLFQNMDYVRGHIENSIEKIDKRESEDNQGAEMD